MSWGKSVELGKQYKAGRAGAKVREVVTIAEDDHGNTLVVSRFGTQRLDEMAPDCIFEPLEESEALELEQKTRREVLESFEDRANTYRQLIDQLESDVCEFLGVGVGDGSPRSDSVQRFVRDGYGSLTIFAELATA